MSERWTAGLINSSRSFPCCTGLRPDRPPLSQRVKGKLLPSPGVLCYLPRLWYWMSPYRGCLHSIPESSFPSRGASLRAVRYWYTVETTPVGAHPIPQYSRIVLSKLRSIASSSAVLVVEQNARLV